MTDDGYAQLRREMVQDQLRRRQITDERVLRAMETVPRHEFVPFGVREQAHDDSALSIGYGQTISQPYMVGLMVSLLQVSATDRVLEVGAGSGYAAAVIGQLAREVYAVELVPELAQRATETIRRLGYDNVHIVVGDGTVGYPAAAPYDRILISAAAPALPEPLVEQLADEGRIVAPVGGRSVQTCEVTTKLNSRLQRERSIDCVFVPLRGLHGWQE